MHRYDHTQRQILEEFDQGPRLRGKGSGKFNGDVCCRILKEFLAREISRDFQLSEPNAYISGHPQEFDLLILTSTAEPIRYTNAFDPTCVKCGIEVKAKGSGYSAHPDHDIQRVRNAFETTKSKYPGIHLVYFTFQESTPRKSTSIQYWRRTLELLKPFKAFCLRNLRTHETHEGEWRRFVEYIESVLQ